MAAPDFAVLDATELPALEPFGLLESLPANVVADAQRWREHLVEVETGLPPDSGPGVTPRAGYDPAITSLAHRGSATRPTVRFEWTGQEVSVPVGLFEFRTCFPGRRQSLAAAWSVIKMTVMIHPLRSFRPPREEATGTLDLRALGVMPLGEVSWVQVSEGLSNDQLPSRPR